MSNIDEYDFTQDLETVYQNIVSISDELKAESLAFQLPVNHKENVPQVKALASKRFNLLSNALDVQLAHLENLVDAVTASYREYEHAMDRLADEAERKEFEESVGDPNGLRGCDDGQAVS